MDKLITNSDSIVSLYQNSFTNPRDVELTLSLKGEATNANSLQAVRHVARAITAYRDARATGLIDTQLITRNLSEINLDIASYAVSAANWAWGFKNVQLESDQNRQPVTINLNVIGSTSSANDPSYDPSIGMDASKSELSEFDDNVTIRTEAEAGDFSNQASTYGINGGLASTDKQKRTDKLSKAPDLRTSLSTNGGDDKISISVQATNSGRGFSGFRNRSDGKQRAVSINKSLVDLGTGNDTISLKSEVLLNGGFLFPYVRGNGNSVKLPGAHTIANQPGIFDGPTSTTNDFNASASADLFESGIDAGDGDDTVNLYNGWQSDIYLGAGNDNVNLSAGNELFIRGGGGNDTISFLTRKEVKDAFADYKEPVYKGVQVIGGNSLHVVSTDEGNVYLDSGVETLNINGQAVALDPIKGAEPSVLSIVEGSAVEGQRLEIRVTRSGPVSDSAVATISIENGTAEEGKDFIKQAPQQIAFAPGQTVASAFFDSIDDKVVETDETVKVNLSTVTAGVTISSPQSIFTLTDNDKARSITKFLIDDASIDEGKPAVIKVRRVGDLSEAQSIQVTTRYGTAEATDVKGGTFAGAFLPNEDTAEINIETVDDDLTESDETLQILGSAITTSGSADTSWERGTAILAIKDNDAVKPTSTFSFKEEKLDIEEGKKGTITVYRTGDLTTNQIVQVKTVASADATTADFVDKTYTLTFAKGVESQKFEVECIADKKSDANESFTIVGGPIVDTGKVSGSWSDKAVTVNIIQILNNPYLIDVSEDTINEGQSLTVTITASDAKAGQPVWYALQGEGVNQDDFSQGKIVGQAKINKKGSLNLALNYTVNEDYSTDEGDEKVTVQLYADKNLTSPLGDPAEFTINDTSIGDNSMLGLDGAVDSFKVGSEKDDTLSISKEEGSKTWALWGLGGNDKLTGGPKNDFFIGGEGKDTLTGGKGQDTFILGDINPKSIDTIKDFNPKDDIIGLTNDIIDAQPDDVVAILKYRDIKNAKTANQFFEDNQANHYVLIDTLANIKKVNGKGFGEQILLAIDTTNKSILLDDDGNWFKGATTLAKLGSVSMNGWTANNFAFGYQFNSGDNYDANAGDNNPG